MAIEITITDEVSVEDAAYSVDVNGTFTPYTRLREVPPQDRFLWVTIPVKMTSPYSKSPGAKLDFGVTWTDWLVGTEAIVSSSWEVPDGLVLEESYVTPEGVAVAWLSGGLDGERYTLTNTITTDSVIARTDTRQIEIWVSA